MIDIKSLNDTINMTVQDPHGVQVTPDLANTVILKLGLDTVKVMRMGTKWTIFHNVNVATKKISVAESMKPVKLA